MLPLLLVASLPALAGWTPTGSKYGCEFSKQDEGEVVALRAECTWDLTADRVIAVIGDWNRHAEVFESVTKSTVLGGWSGGKARVLQNHQASGISDREVVLDVTVEDIDGGKRWRHTKSADQHELSGDKVEVGRDDGLWEVKASPDGGCTVLYELRYDPAGSVPGFIVKAFQGSGFKDMLLQVRTAAGG